MKIVNINVVNFKEQVLAQSTPVLVDFWAPWCGPCVMMLPILESLAHSMTDMIKICKVNIDENPELAATFSIRSIPTLLLFHKGELRDTKTGTISKAVLEEWLNSYL